MKVKTLHVMSTLISLDFRMSLDGLKHKIEYIQEGNYFLVDELTIIPMSNVREVILQKPLVEEVVAINIEVEELKRLRKESASKREKKVK